MTSSLTELWKVGVFPVLRISKSVVIKYSSRSFPLELVSVLPHNVWWELASHPNKSGRPLTLQKSTSVRTSSGGLVLLDGK